MQRMLRTCLGIAAYLAVAAAHSAPLSTGSYVLGSHLAAPGSFEAVFTADAGTGNLSFDLLGFKSLDGYNNCCGDVFHLGLNGTEIFVGAFNLGGGGSNAILSIPNGGTASRRRTGPGRPPQLASSHLGGWRQRHRCADHPARRTESPDFLVRGQDARFG